MLSVATTRSDHHLEPLPGSIPALLREVAAARPAALYVDFLDGQNRSHELTFSQVLAGAERWGRGLLECHLSPGARIALLLPTGEEFLQAFFGTQLAGCVPVPLAFPMSLGNPEPFVATQAQILSSAAPALLVTIPQLEQAARTLMAAAGKGEVVLAGTIGSAGATAPAVSWPALGLDDLALVQYTSGRVRQPTGALLTHRAVLGNVQGLGTALRLRPDDVALTWVPLVHDMGLIGGLLTSLYWQIPLHVMSPQTFLMHPSLWLKNISQLGVTLAAAPNAGYQLCVRRVSDRQLAGLDLSRWRLALNGAETVHPATVDAFCQRFAAVGFDRRAICPVYGLAENTLATACPDLASPEPPYQLEALPGQPPVVSVGRPLAGQELSVVGEDGQPLPERTEGEVVVRGVSLMRGYLGEAEATARAIDPAGWLHTGDLGFLSQGRLFLTGRRKELVIKLGRNYYPSDIEELLVGFPGLVGPSLAFAVASPTEGTDLLVLYVESEARTPEGQRPLDIEVNGHLLARLGIRADQIIHVPPATLTDPTTRTQLRAKHSGSATQGEQLT